MRPEVSVVIPAYEEGPWLAENLRTLIDAVTYDAEFLVVVDSESDSSLGQITDLMKQEPSVKSLINTYGKGPANALRFGIDASQGNIVVVFMSDGCDDALQVDSLCRLVSRGVAIACASRYAPSGQQVGGPRLKRFLSKLAGLSFNWLTGVGTKDATNSFKAYQRKFLNEVEIESSSGFEVGIELVAKAHRAGLSVAEIPTTWIDRSDGESKFQLFKWIPSYLKWYLVGIGLIRLKERKKENVKN
jgi:dolichol-phosphate mannosyltransferase